jgi:nucleoside-diphosphate-sugar epimerase
VKVVVTGGCGYKGAVLVPKLLCAGHEVRVFDAQWFGVNLQPHRNLMLMKGDIRSGVPEIGWADAIIHLAGIANDPCGELDAKLTWEVNVLATMRLADAAARAGVKQFIFASSASVYGLKGDQAVVEDDTMEPVSDYNRTKMCAERILLSYAPRMGIQIIRPATVCGVSPRQRLDTMVNSLTMQAITKGVITAHCGEHGGELMRPNCHIEDVCAAYQFFLDHSHLTGVYNCGFENLSASATAKLIENEVPATINITKVKDKRSYAVNSNRIISVGFEPKHTVQEAIRDLVAAHGEGRIKEEPRAYNLQWMRDNGLAKI